MNDELTPLQRATEHTRSAIGRAKRAAEASPFDSHEQLLSLWSAISAAEVLVSELDIEADTAHLKEVTS